MDYNTQRGKMIIPEYGRNIQKMIEYTSIMPDRDKRTQAAHVIINIMSQINPGVRESTEYQRSLWDHMYIISNFKLEVESPFPPPSRDQLTRKPDKIAYSDKRIRFPHYGKNIVAMIQKAIDYEEGPEKEALVLTIANHLKKSYLNWNRDSVNDETIIKHLADLSNNKLIMTESQKLSATGEILSRNKPKKKNFKQKGKDGNGKRKHYSSKNF